MRIPDDQGRAVKRPAWYVRSLANRPDDVAQRGPWRLKRQKVEDVPRLDAHQLYGNATALRTRWGQIFRRGQFTGFGWEIFEEGTRVAKPNGTRIILSPRQEVPRRRYRKVTAQCPGCDGQFRYLNVIGNDPRCRRCHGLIYKSQARSQVVRFRRRFDLAQRKGWDRVRRVPPGWCEQFWRLDDQIERRREDREMIERWRLDYQIERRREDRETVKRMEGLSKQVQCTDQLTRWDEARRRARAAWRKFVKTLDSANLRQNACAFRRVMRLLDRQGWRDSKQQQEMLHELQRLTRYWGEDSPHEVVAFDAFFTIETDRRNRFEIYNKMLSAYVRLADSDDQKIEKEAKAFLNTEARKQQINLGKKSPQKLGEEIVERFRHTLYSHWDRMI